MRPLREGPAYNGAYETVSVAEEKCRSSNMEAGLRIMDTFPTTGIECAI